MLNASIAATHFSVNHLFDDAVSLFDTTARLFDMSDGGLTREQRRDRRFASRRGKNDTSLFRFHGRFGGDHKSESKYGYRPRFAAQLRAAAEMMAEGLADVFDREARRQKALQRMASVKVAEVSKKRQPKRIDTAARESAVAAVAAARVETTPVVPPRAQVMPSIAYRGRSAMRATPRLTNDELRARLGLPPRQETVVQ